MFKLAFLSLLLGAVALLLGAVLYHSPGAGDLLASSWSQYIGALLETAFEEWRAYRPWAQDSINSYMAAKFFAIPFNPVPTAALWLATSMLFYRILSTIFKTKGSFDWRVIGGLTLVCWITLDAFWQMRLLHQLIDTRHQFSGKSRHEKLTAASDGELYTFISRGLGRIESPAPRFFIGTSDEYLAVRGGYHLYPGNVFWQRHGPELPDKAYMRSGDYIVILAPTFIEYQQAENLLCLPEFECIKAEPILVEQAGGFFRVL